MQASRLFKANGSTRIELTTEQVKQEVSTTRQVIQVFEERQQVVTFGPALVLQATWALLQLVPLDTVPWVSSVGQAGLVKLAASLLAGLVIPPLLERTGLIYLPYAYTVVANVVASVSPTIVKLMTVAAAALAVGARVLIVRRRALRSGPRPARRPTVASGPHPEGR